MNRVNIVGRLTKDPELKTTDKGTNLLSITLAVNENKDTTHFINCVAFNKTAEFISTYLKKGFLVGVDGHISTRNYKETDRTIYVVEVIIDKIESYEKKDNNTNDDELKIDEDDLPF